MDSKGSREFVGGKARRFTNLDQLVEQLGLHLDRDQQPAVQGAPTWPPQPGDAWVENWSGDEVIVRCGRCEVCEAPRVALLGAHVPARPALQRVCFPCCNTLERITAVELRLEFV